MKQGEIKVEKRKKASEKWLAQRLNSDASGHNLWSRSPFTIAMSLETKENSHVLPSIPEDAPLIFFS